MGLGCYSASHGYRVNACCTTSVEFMLGILADGEGFFLLGDLHWGTFQSDDINKHLHTHFLWRLGWTPLGNGQYLLQFEEGPTAQVSFCGNIALGSWDFLAKLLNTQPDALQQGSEDSITMFQEIQRWLSADAEWSAESRCFRPSSTGRMSDRFSREHAALKAYVDTKPCTVLQACYDGTMMQLSWLSGEPLCEMQASETDLLSDIRIELMAKDDFVSENVDVLFP